MFSKKYLWIIISAILVVASIAFYTFTISSASTGEKLAKQYCSSCHEFPSPNLLTKKSWDYLLTYMGFHLGIKDYNYLKGSPRIVMENINSKEKVLFFAGRIPDQPILSDKEWRAIRQYYNEMAPFVSLPQKEKKPINENLTLFDLKFPSHQPSGSVNTMVRIDEVNSQIMVGNNGDQTLAYLNKDLEVIKIHSGYELLVDAKIAGDSLYLLSIGDLMGRYVGMKKGLLILAQGKSNEPLKKSILNGELLRPADMEFADLDNDGTDEIVVCNFGDVTGSISILKKNDNNRYQLDQELLNLPGAVKCTTFDFNKDGLKDIAVLMGDARENLSLFINLGNNKFKRKVVIENNSAYGYVYFELQDFNKDGYVDIMTVNGDSDADPYNTLKNYHGIRIYLNDGENNFQEKYFYPMYGVHFAKASDFDLDGDLDIAAVSFFPDFDQTKPENFTYLENKGDFNFEPFTNPGTYQGRWMVMDIGDMDHDGDVDIVLGGCYIPLGMVVNYQKKFKEMQVNGKALMVFENKTR